MAILEEIINNPIFAPTEEEGGGEEKQTPRQSSADGRAIANDFLQDIQQATTTTNNTSNQRANLYSGLDIPIKKDEVANVANESNSMDQHQAKSQGDSAIGAIIGDIEQIGGNNQDDQRTYTIPEGMDEEKYNRLVKNFGRDKVHEWYSNDNDRNTVKGLAEASYTHSKRMPEPPSEKEMKQRSLMANIGDSLSLLAQVYTHSKGAHQEVRKQEDFATPKFEKKAYELQKLYKSHETEYNRGLEIARNQDFIRRLANRDKGQQYAENFLLKDDQQRALKEKQQLDREFNQRKLDDSNRRADEKAKLDGDKFEFDKAYKIRTLADKDKDREERRRLLEAKNKHAMELADKRAQMQKEAHEQRMKLQQEKNKGKTSGSGGTNKGLTDLYIKPTEDYKGQTFENPVTKDNNIKLQLSDGMLTYFFNAAKKDEGFVEIAENVYFSAPIGDITQKWEKKDEVANAYIQYLFDTQPPSEVERMRQAIEADAIRQHTNPIQPITEQQQQQQPYTPPITSPDVEHKKDSINSDISKLNEEQYTDSLYTLHDNGISIGQADVPIEREDDNLVNERVATSEELNNTSQLQDTIIENDSIFVNDSIQADARTEQQRSILDNVIQSSKKDSIYNSNAEQQMLDSAERRKAIVARKAREEAIKRIENYRKRNESENRVIDTENSSKQNIMQNDSIKNAMKHSQQVPVDTTGLSEFDEFEISEERLNAVKGVI